MKRDDFTMQLAVEDELTVDSFAAHAQTRDRIVRLAMRLAAIYERGDAAADRAVAATTARARAAAERKVDATCPMQDRALVALVKACRQHRQHRQQAAA